MRIMNISDFLPINSNLPIYTNIQRFPPEFQETPIITKKVAVYLIGLTLLEVFYFESLDVLFPLEGGNEFMGDKQQEI